MHGQQGVKNGRSKDGRQGDDNGHRGYDHGNPDNSFVLHRVFLLNYGDW
jgi:hypothetical protein